jgi:aminopeptidase N
MGGGLNLRGFAGYYTPDNRNGSILTSYKGRSGASINLEVDVDKYFSIRPKFTKNWLHVDVYGFADAGVMELSYYSGTDIYNLSPASKMSDVRMDAGIGTAFTIKKWGAFDKARPLTIRFDMPFFINRAPYSHPEYTAFRYVVGINRTF